MTSARDQKSISKNNKLRFSAHHSKEKYLTKILNDLDFYLSSVFICKTEK